MGLGIAGGGLGAARFLHSQGALVTVTDLKGSDELQSSLEALPDGIRLALDGHQMSDFTGADLVIKNPGVRPNSPFLSAAKEAGVEIQTDLSLFLARCPSPVLAVTGSKGKSTTAAALAAILQQEEPMTQLGGNIGRSPLDFLTEISAYTPVVLELSSWQLADLRDSALLSPTVAVITNLLPDHQNRYQSMEEYMADKRVITESQPPGSWLILNRDDPWYHRFAEGTAANIALFSSHTKPTGDGAWMQNGVGHVSLNGHENVAFHTPGTLELRNEDIPGPISTNLLAAAAAAAVFGSKTESIYRGLDTFRGLPHRLELLGEVGGIRFINDSAATIPEATAAALASVSSPVVLLAGGADKELDFMPMASAASSLQRCVLLAGSATAKLLATLSGSKVICDGPFDTMEEAFKTALCVAAPGTTILLSPGCASFGMFLNEFDRGDHFRKLVRELAEPR